MNRGQRNLVGSIASRAGKRLPASADAGRLFFACAGCSMASCPTLSSSPSPSTPRSGASALALRTEIFVGEQHVPPELERDAYDAVATHIVALVEGDVVGVLRIVFLPEHAKFGRVAVAAHCPRSRHRLSHDALCHGPCQQPR